MHPRRRRDGFRLAGSVELGQLKLPRAKSRELVLARAWRRVAGEAVGQRVTAHEGRGGVLILRVVDDRWARVLVELLPQLAARLAADCPEIGVARFKIEGCAREPLAQPLPARTPDEGPPIPPAVQAPAQPDPRPPRERLEALAEIYLKRQKP